MGKTYICPFCGRVFRVRVDEVAQCPHCNKVIKPDLLIGKKI